MAPSSKRVEERDAAELFQPAALWSVKREYPRSSLVEVDLAGHSHAGNVRPNNEDHYVAVRLERSLQTVLSNLPDGEVPRNVEETVYGMVVADGMGGMPAGGLASSMALRTLIDLVVKTPDWIMRMNRRKAAVLKRRMIERFRQVDVALRERGERDPRLAGMGTTMTVAASLGSHLFIAHLGDSRAYLQRGSSLYQLTRDHTLSQAMIEAGVASAEEESVRSVRRVLTAGLGTIVKASAPEVQRLFLEHDDQLLLCTDGLTEFVDSETISTILLSAESAEEACRELTNAALARGSHDNITVVLARYRFPQKSLEDQA